MDLFVQKLELDIQRKLQEFQDQTGLRITDVKFYTYSFQDPDGFTFYFPSVKIKVSK